ncbi:MAG: hypothetical protein EOO91_02170 [Pedobacter sp.]|nr:MAG: hypothetical protein EOO91_02170 [Pedobacter sp.]
MGAAKKRYLPIIFYSLIALLVLLWTYSSLSKLMDFKLFKSQLEGQSLGAFTASLAWAVPMCESIVCLLLLSKATRTMGLWLSIILLISFTAYISLTLMDYFEKRPCSCGGVLSGMSWNTHLLFNLFFIAVNGLALWLVKKIVPVQPNLLE